MNALTRNIALLIDADNAQSAAIDPVLSVLAELGTVNVRRAYGNWSKPGLKGWRDVMVKHGIEPQQQFDVTKGKSATDMKMIIDAMDLLWMGNVDAFALVSSDSDFTRLATRLREGGKRVIGLGARKTPASLRNAVDQFIYLELLGTATDHDVDDDETGEDTPAKEENAKASEGSGRSGSRRGGRGRGRGSKTTDAADTYPVVLVSYLIACQSYSDQAEADLVKGYLSYIVSDEGQKAAADNAGAAPLSSSVAKEAQGIVDKITASS